MPSYHYQVTSPDGKKYKVTVPEGTSIEEVQAQISQLGTSPTSLPNTIPHDTTAPLSVASHNVGDVPDLPKPQLAITKGIDYLMNTEGAIPTAIDSAGFGFGNEITRFMQALYGGSFGSEKGTMSSVKQRTQELIAKDEKAKKDLASSDPGGYAALTMAPALVPGGLAAKLLNPKTFKAGVGLATGEGAVFGAGEAEQGEKIEGALKGGAAGTVLGTGGSLVQRLLAPVPRTISGISELFGNKKPMTPKEASTAAELHVANELRRQGIDPNDLTLQPGETIADTISGEGGPLIKALTAHNEDATNLLRKHDAIPRSEEISTARRVQDDLSLGRSEGVKSSFYNDTLEKSRKEIGSKIEKQIQATRDVPLDNQEELHDFLELDSLKNVLRDAKIRRSGRDYGTKPKSEIETPDIDETYIDAATTPDGNLPVIDEALAQDIGAVIQGKINRAKKGGGDEAFYIDLKEKWEDLLETGASSSKMRELRSRYGSVRRKQKLYTEGSDNFGSERLTGLSKKVNALEPEDLTAYRNGVIEHYADKPDTLLKEIGTAEGREKIAIVFGSGKVKQSDTIRLREGRFASTADALKQGLQQRGKITTEEITLRDQFQAVATLFTNLQGKRAYSARGGAFLVANEIVDIINRSALSDEAVTEMARIISLSGNDAEKLLKKLGETRMPEIQQALNAATRKQSSRARTTGVMGGIGSQGYSVVDQLMDRPSHQ